MALSPDQRRKENKKRWDFLNTPYNAFLGVGSHLSRFAVSVFVGITVMLPVSMQEDGFVKAIIKAGSLETLAEQLGRSYDDLLLSFNALRMAHDFEFWVMSCVKIETKEKGVQPFILNFPQRILLAEFERQRLLGIPIRVILLKHRQWGGSTLTQIYMSWIQLFHKTNWNSMIVADVKEKASHIRAMYERMAQYHPTDIVKMAMGVPKIELQRYQGTANFKEIGGRGNIIGVASVESPNAPRSFTMQMLHLSEVGLWKSTPMVNAEDLAQGLYGSLVSAPYTFCCKESTGKGVGTYFHKEWVKAEKNESNDVPVFIEWFRDVQYSAPIADLEKFIGSMSEYENYLWEKGATLEHINWYRNRKKDYPEEWRLRQEFPSTAEEAFQSTGNRRFPIENVNKMRRFCTEPAFIGELVSENAKGPRSLAGIEFIDNKNGKLRIWNKPFEQGMEKKGHKYTNRYCGFADIGGTTDKADYCTITILDRIMTLYGGVPVVACEFRGHMDADLFAWYGARLSTWYDKALFAIEVNSLKEDKGDVERGFDSDHAFTVLDEIKLHYDNLFYRIKPQQLTDKWDGVVGFHTNKSTKPMIIDALHAGMRDEEYEERSFLACDEFDLYETKPDGTLGAVDGKHDDLVISRAGAIWLSNSMEPVTEYKENDRSYYTARKGGYAIHG